MPEKHDHPTGPKYGPPHHGLLFYSELNRVISVLFVGVLALMTFLLTVGVQRPHANFSWAIYSSIVLLSLNLIAYVAGHLFHAAYMAKFAPGAADEAETDKQEDKADKTDDKAGDKKDKAGQKGPAAQREAARRRLMGMRIVQQVLFVLAVASVAWLALAAAQFFFAIPAMPAGGAQPQ